VGGTDLDRRRELGRVAREAHRGRVAALDARVPAVERQLERLGTGTVGTERGLQVVQQRAVVIRDVPKTTDRMSTLDRGR
jgi:hypothetical protein